MKPQTWNLKLYLPTIGLILLAFTFYYLALAPSVTAIFDDSLEFALVVHRLGIAHPTGYPLYTLLGKLFSLFNPANVAFQLNLMSAVFAALSVGLLYQLGLAIAFPTPTIGSHAGAALGAMLFGLGPVFFSQSLIAEVYTLHAFFVAGTLLLATRKMWLPLTFWFGLGLTHHRTIILLAPALALFVAIEFGLHRKAGWRRLLREMPPLKTACAFFAPLLIYLYLPLRGHIGTLEGTYQNTVAGFFSHIAGGGYGTAFLLDNPFGSERTAAFYVSLLNNELGWWGLAFGLLGIGRLIQRGKWNFAGLTLLAFGTSFGFNIFYNVADIEVFFIPVFLIIALWAGLGMGVILNLRGKKHPALIVFVGLLIAGFLISRDNRPSQADNWTVHDYGLDILHSAEPESIIVGIQGQLSLVRYFQETTGLRADINTVRGDTEAERLAILADLMANDANRPVYTLNQLNGAAERWSLSNSGPLIEVKPQPLRVAPGFDHPINALLTPEISLPGYSISRPTSHQAIPPIRLTLVWQVNQAVPAELKVSARLLNQAGEIISGVDKVPVDFTYPTTFWRSGEFITDVYDLTLPPDLPAGEVTPLIILYDPANNAAEVGRATLWNIYVDGS